LSIIGLHILLVFVFAITQFFVCLWYHFDVLTTLFQQPKLPGL